MWISFIFQYILNMFPISSFPGTDEDATGRATCEVGKGGKIGGIGGPVIAMFERDHREHADPSDPKMEISRDL